MKCTFQVGDRVVCVDAARSNRLDIQELEEGQVYTIAWIGPTPADMVGLSEKDIGVCVRLAEIPKRACMGFLDNPTDPFGAFRFRPVKPMSFWIGEKRELELESR
jgi:hypothetical protein